MQIILSSPELRLMRGHLGIWVLLFETLESKGGKKIKITFDKLAKAGGYANRSGAWKYIKKLERAGVIEKTVDKQFIVNLPIIL